jgi:hypothetical protein
VAQTKRKRRSKHRGNAAGAVEARGRTSRPLTADERKKQTRTQAREERLNKPPTWRSSLNRALIAAALMFGFLLLTSKGKDKVITALVFGVFALLIYIPAGYYIELMMWRRRMRKKGLAK